MRSPLSLCLAASCALAALADGNAPSMSDVDRAEMVQELLAKEANEKSAKNIVKQIAKEVAAESAGSDRPLEERLRPESVAKMKEMMEQMSPEEAQEFRVNLESLGRDNKRMKAAALKKKAAGGEAGGRKHGGGAGSTTVNDQDDGPPPNDVTPEVARAVLEDLLAALRSDSGKAALAEARSTGSLPAEAGIDAQGRNALEAVDKIARPILARKGLTDGGVLSAVSAFSATAKHAKDLGLARLIAELGELITGKPVQSKAGRVEALDDLAMAWAREAADARRVTLGKAEALLEGLGPEAGPAAEEYVIAMRGLLEDGEDFVQERMVGIISQLGDADDEQKASSKARLNVLDLFMGPGGDKRLAERVKEVASERASSRKTKKRRRKIATVAHTEL